jgi:hypothetical protein
MARRQGISGAMTLSRSCALLAFTVTLALVPATADAEIRNGSFGAGRLKPADPSLRIVRTNVSYDSSSGKLEGTVTARGPVARRTVGVAFLVGTYDRQRRCRGTARQPTGALTGDIGTFSLPPDPDPNLYGLKATRLAFLGRANLGDSAVDYSASGPTATLSATIGLFADRPWNCAYTQLYNTRDGGDGAKDETLYFPLGSKAIAENRRLQRLAVRRCGKRAKRARAACVRKAKERYPVG